MSATKLLDDFLTDVVSQVAELGIRRRHPRYYPFDSLAGQIITKSVSLGRAVMILLDTEHNDEAFGLSRSIVECALTLKYITVDIGRVQQRALKFIFQSQKDRNFWLFWTLKRAKTEEDRAQLLQLAKERGYVADDSSAYKHWSGERNFIRMSSEMIHPLDPSDLEPEYNSLARAADYYYPSCYVHCSEPGLESMINFDDPFISAVPSAKQKIETGKRAEVIVFQYIKQVISYTFYGMNVTAPKSFRCHRDYMYSELHGVYLKVAE